MAVSHNFLSVKNIGADTGFPVIPEYAIFYFIFR